jgi:hypothetical protein
VRAAHAAAAASPAHYEAHHNRGIAAGRLAAVARGALRDAASGRGTLCAAGVADDAPRFEADAGAAYEAALAPVPAHVSAAQNLSAIRHSAGATAVARALYKRVLAAAQLHARAPRHGRPALSPRARHANTPRPGAACKGVHFLRCVCGSPPSRRVRRAAQLRSARTPRAGV